MANINRSKINNFISSALNSIPLPGLSMAITNQKETLYTIQYGKGINANSSFALGSTSKAITATALLMLFDEYPISLNTPICNYLSWIASTNSITVLDLLNHTSGISTYETMDNLKYSGTYGSFEYSNANYHLLAEIIENITGKDFSNYTDERIFSKLNMHNSFALSKDTSKNIVQGYNSFFGLLLPCKVKIPDKTTWIQAPSGYLCASSADMSEYLRFLLSYSHDSQHLLQFIKNIGVQVDKSPAFEGIYDDSGIYGLGWICKNVNGVDILYHTGKLSNFCSLSVLIPQKNLGITIMCNVGDFLVSTSLIEKLYEGIVSILIDSDNVPNFNKRDYLRQHSVINIVLLVLMGLCVLPALLYSVNGTLFRLSVINVCILFLIHIVVPIILLKAFPIIGIPYEVVVDFAPDIFWVLVSCSSILFVTGAWKLVFLLITK